ncbi:MAG TPA: hypothetical protein VN823_09105 [Stellaceae bacterium]|nr:hypothetical protein [Stellaceae bacterium]
MNSLSTSASATLPTREATPGATVRSLVVALVLVGLTLSPLLGAAVPPLVDYPNHLARMWILAQNGALPDLASNYAVDWRLLPDLAMDLIVPPLAQVMPLEAAGRLFIALTMVILVAGTMTLYRALNGRLTLWPLSALLFLYNAALFWGFLNCLFGIGVFLLAFSGWIESRHWRAAPRIVVFAGLASLLFVLHLFAFCLYALAVGSYELGGRLAERKLSLRGFLSLCAAGLQFIPGGLLWIVSLQNSGPTYTEYGGLGAKVYALQAPFTFGPQAVLFDKLLLIVCVAFLAMAIAARALKLAPEMRLVLVAMILAAVAMPTWMSGSWLADIRLPVALPFVMIASTRLDESRFRAVGWFAAIAVMLLAVRVWAISEVWRDAGPRFAEFRAASRVIIPGARLLIVDDTAKGGWPVDVVPSFVGLRWGETFTHMPALAVIDRSAFIPYLFTGWTSIVPTARNAGLFKTEAMPLTADMLREGAIATAADPASNHPGASGEPRYWSDWPKHFDFVLWIDFGSASEPGLATLQPVAQGSFFRIYRVAPPS